MSARVHGGRRAPPPMTTAEIASLEAVAEATLAELLRRVEDVARGGRGSARTLASVLCGVRRQFARVERARHPLRRGTRTRR